jgi:hypothetical protein
MGTSTDYLIDIGLNVAGFLAAGLLTALLYSLITERRKKIKPAIASGGVSSSAAEVYQPMQALKNSKIDFEFIDLSGAGRKSDVESAVLSPRGEYRVRDRQEILRQAKRMLTQKKGNSGVGKSLPLTVGELAFIKQNINPGEIERKK